MLRLESNRSEGEADPTENKCKDFLLGFAKKLSSRSMGGFLRNLRQELPVLSGTPVAQG